MAGDIISRTDRINEMTRLLMHRLFVRVLRSDPSYLFAARHMISEQLRHSHARSLTLWRDFLTLPNEQIWRILVSYHDNAVWLRQTSPLGTIIPKSVLGFDYAEPAIRRKVWQKSAQFVDFLLRRRDRSPGRTSTGAMFTDFTDTHNDSYNVMQLDTSPAEPITVLL
ncbi:hypothetical protein [Ensifer sp. LC163]|uniref:hypothetical protein n=1 Tax=Ensifer sp. LC163 TaxID=1120652 RepID=UPI0008136EC5|nr:hypothetical protein [Ensifer sp. LC163]OCP36456.1 hypothetical protein BC360_24320 [Ensifer sp. LC163]